MNEEGACMIYLLRLILHAVSTKTLRDCEMQFLLLDLLSTDACDRSLRYVQCVSVH